MMNLWFDLNLTKLQLFLNVNHMTMKIQYNESPIHLSVTGSLFWQSPIVKVCWLDGKPTI